MKLYTTPEIRRKQGNWHIYFQYNKTVVRKTFNLNRIKNIKDREIEAISCLLSVKNNLERGWNPLTNTFGGVHSDNFNFKEALEYALEKKRVPLASKSFKDYSGAVGQIVKASARLNLDTYPISDISRKHLKLIFENFHNTKTGNKRYPSISNHRYNKVLGYIKSLFSELMEWEVIDSNPATDIKLLPEAEGKGYAKADNDQQAVITEHLKAVNYPFYVFVAFLYHTLVRPKEALQIQIKDIKSDLSSFTIIPDLRAENLKVKKVRHVPINSHLKELLEEMDIFKFKRNYYLFGTDRNDQAHLEYREAFKPNPFKMERKVATDLWRNLVKKGLGINADMYATKHKSIDDKILSGVDLDHIRQLAGHHNKMMTEKYASKLMEVAAKSLNEKARKF